MVTISAWWRKRSRIAVALGTSPISLPQSSRGRFDGLVVEGLVPHPDSLPPFDWIADGPDQTCAARYSRAYSSFGPGPVYSRVDLMHVTAAGSLATFGRRANQHDVLIRIVPIRFH